MRRGQEPGGYTTGRDIFAVDEQVARHCAQRDHRLGLGEAVGDFQSGLAPYPLLSPVGARAQRLTRPCLLIATGGRCYAIKESGEWSSPKTSAIAYACRERC